MYVKMISDERNAHPLPAQARPVPLPSFHRLTIQNPQSYIAPPETYKECNMTSASTLHDQSTLLRLLPSVDEIVTRLKNDGDGGASDSVLSAAAREAIGARRQLLLEQTTRRPSKTAGNPSTSEDVLRKSVLNDAKRILASNKQLGLRKVINATGIVIHTNLGRAPLSDGAKSALNDVAGGYSNLEFDLSLGLRGKRGADVQSLLCRLTGAEAALVVNNNAAAVMFAIPRDGPSCRGNRFTGRVGRNWRLLPDSGHHAPKWRKAGGSRNDEQNEDIRLQKRHYPGYGFAAQGTYQQLSDHRLYRIGVARCSLETWTRRRHTNARRSGKRFISSGCRPPL